MEEWLAYAPPESLTQFMYQKPTQAKRLFFDVIPRNVDDYLRHVAKYPEQDGQKQLENPAWHIHSGAPPREDAHLSYNILLNLAGVCNSEDKDVLWHFITRYRPDATPENAPTLDRLTEYAVNYFRDFVKPNKTYRLPDDAERAALEDLDATLEALPADAEAEEIQTQIYEVGKRYYGEDLKSWFKALYETLGQSTGPRMGSFVALYGINETRALVGRVLGGEDLGAD
jgi:lysyl-tRNA synthetase class 1